MQLTVPGRSSAGRVRLLAMPGHIVHLSIESLACSHSTKNEPHPAGQVDMAATPSAGESEFQSPHPEMEAVRALRDPYARWSAVRTAVMVIRIITR